MLIDITGDELYMIIYKYKELIRNNGVHLYNDKESAIDAARSSERAYERIEQLEEAYRCSWGNSNG